MKRYCRNWIEEWCAENGWTDLFTVRRNEYWAFPPHAVIPLPIPHQEMHSIKQRKGLSPDEKRWCFAAIAATALAGILSYFSHSPMPWVAAFIFSAIVVAQMDTDD